MSDRTGAGSGRGRPVGGRSWSVRVAVTVALIPLVGSFTVGGDAVIHRLTHPGRPLGFVEYVLHLAVQVTTVIAAAGYLIGSAAHRRQERRPSEESVRVHHGAGGRA